jgi:hypothetical protein
MIPPRFQHREKPEITFDLTEFFMAAPPHMCYKVGCRWETAPDLAESDVAYFYQQIQKMDPSSETAKLFLQHHGWWESMARNAGDAGTMKAEIVDWLRRVRPEAYIGFEDDMLVKPRIRLD